jgi:hypothetical protein
VVEDLDLDDFPYLAEFLLAQSPKSELEGSKESAWLPPNRLLNQSCFTSNDSTPPPRDPAQDVKTQPSNREAIPKDGSPFACAFSCENCRHSFRRQCDLKYISHPPYLSTIFGSSDLGRGTDSTSATISNRHIRGCSSVLCGAARKLSAYPRTSSDTAIPYMPTRSQVHPSCISARMSSVPPNTRFHEATAQRGKTMCGGT